MKVTCCLSEKGKGETDRQNKENQVPNENNKHSISQVSFSNT